MNDDYFQLFGLPAGFFIDADTLVLRYRELQRAVHPDRHAGGTERERLLAVQQAARINDAYQTLKDPLARARYLLSLQGIELKETDTHMEPAFLMLQMELREALEETAQAADPFEALARLRAQADEIETNLLGELATLFQAERESWTRIPERLRKLQFMRKLQDEIDEREDELADGI